jgi:hypothetical protein
MNYLQNIATLYQLDHLPCGLPEAEITAAEQRLGIRFPAMLREYLLTLGGSEAVNQSFNRLLPLEKIDFDGDYLVLIEEYQGVFLCGIAKADLAQDNPPIHIGFYTDETESYEWQPHLPDTSALLLELAYTNAAMGGLRYCANIMDEESTDAQAVQFIQQNRTEIKELRKKTNAFTLTAFTKSSCFVLTKTATQTAYSSAPPTKTASIRCSNCSAGTIGSTPPVTMKMMKNVMRNKPPIISDDLSLQSKGNPCPKS